MRNGWPQRILIQTIRPPLPHRIDDRLKGNHHAPEGVLRVTLKAMALTGRAAGLAARMGLAAKAFLETMDCISLTSVRWPETSALFVAGLWFVVVEGLGADPLLSLASMKALAHKGIKDLGAGSPL